LRAIVGDPLFVRSGRGIVATARAQALVDRARPLLEGLRSFVTSGGFDPAALRTTVTLAANDLQRDLLLPALLAMTAAQAPGLTWRVIPSDVPKAEMLRDGLCDLVVSPRPPDAADLLQKRLFEDHYEVFYDPAMRSNSPSLTDYLAADHVTVVYEPRRTLDLDSALAQQGLHRRFVATVPGFAGIGPLLRGSRRLATAPSLLRASLLRDLASCAPPCPCPTMPMYLIWHVRHHQDEMHQWLRQQIEAAVPAALAAAQING
jgi:DNA-binding transcriptional LysR family regulator